MEGLSVAFVGLGIMGRPMAAHLARAGHRVRVWNRSPSSLAAAEAAGLQPCASAADAASGADVLILMVSDGPACDAVLFGEDGGMGAAAALAPDSTVIVMSSIPVETAREQAERLAPRGIHYMDAPVSGGERGAVEGTLTIMAGAEPEVFERCRALVSAMGRVTRVGPIGCGQLAKLANQTIVGITIGAVAEALLLARAGGADLDAVLEALQGGFADSTVLRQHGRRMSEGRFQPGAHATTQLKDLRTSRQLGEALALDLPLLRLTEGLYREMCAGELAVLDHSALWLLLQRRAAGLESA